MHGQQKDSLQVFGVAQKLFGYEGSPRQLLVFLMFSIFCTMMNIVLDND